MGGFALINNYGDSTTVLLEVCPKLHLTTGFAQRAFGKQTAFIIGISDVAYFFCNATTLCENGVCEKKTMKEYN
jgi:hypothetical protein